MRPDSSPIFDYKTGHTLKMTGVIGDQHGINTAGMGGNPHVHAANRRPVLFQSRANQGVMFRGSLIPAPDHQMTGEVINNRPRLFMDSMAFLALLPLQRSQGTFYA